MRFTALAVAAALSFAAWSSPASAGDFNFTVPVEVVNLPPAIDRGHVRCIVMFSTASSTLTAGDVRSTEFAVTGGAYRGTVRVEVTTSRDYRAAAVTDYMCSLWFHVRRTDGRESNYSAEDLALGDPYPIEARLTPQPGRASMAGGRIPR